MSDAAIEQLLVQTMRAEMMVGSAEHRDFARRLLVEDSSSSAARVSEMLMTTLENTQLSDETKESVRRDVLTFTSGSLVWAELGFPVFNLTLDFFKALLVTDFGDMGEEVVQLPFPAFIINCPEPLVEDTRHLFIYPVPILTERSEQALPHDHYTRLTLESSEKNARRQAFTQWPAGITFNNFLKGRPQSMEALDPVEAKATKDLGTTMDPTSTALARRVLGNLLLYINANGGVPREKRLGADVAVEKEHKTEPRFRVGRPVKLGPQMRNALSYAARQNAEPAWKLAQRFIVRGHWRMQAHGPQRALRKRMWIEPHWKGPTDLTEALERTFEVE